MTKKIISAFLLSLALAACGDTSSRNEAGISILAGKTETSATYASTAQSHCESYNRDAYPASTSAAPGGKRVISFRCLSPTYALRQADNHVVVLFSPQKATADDADKKAGALCAEEGGKATRRSSASAYQGPMKSYTGWQQISYLCTL